LIISHMHQILSSVPVTAHPLHGPCRRTPWATPELHPCGREGGKDAVGHRSRPAGADARDDAFRDIRRGGGVGRVPSSRFGLKYVSWFPRFQRFFIADSSAWATMADDVMCRQCQPVALGGLHFGSRSRGDLTHESSRWREQDNESKMHVVERPHRAASDKSAVVPYRKAGQP
jgi:hypothetical protein